jgi:LPS-assembly lipoprotein
MAGYGLRPNPPYLFKLARKMLKAFSSLILICFISACGFHLRGTGPGTFPYATASVLGDSAVALQLKQSLASLPGVTLSANKPAVVINVINESTEQKVLTVNNAGRVSEYRLFYRITYSVQAGERQLLENGKLQLNRDYSYDENNSLGKDAEASLLIADMQQDAAQQILRRISALAKAQNVP